MQTGNACYSIFSLNCQSMKTPIRAGKTPIKPAVFFFFLTANSTQNRKLNLQEK